MNNNLMMVIMGGLGVVRGSVIVNFSVETGNKKVHFTALFTYYNYVNKKEL